MSSLWHRFWESDNTLVEALQTIVFTIFLILVVGVPLSILSYLLNPPQ